MPNGHKKPVAFIEQIKECFELAAKIQNAGIATVFVNFEAHISSLQIALHFPFWQPGIAAGETLSFYTDVFEDYTEEEQNAEYVQPVISRLKDILATAADIKSEQEVLAEQEKKRKYELLRELQLEFQNQPELA